MRSLAIFCTSGLGGKLCLGKLDNLAASRAEGLRVDLRKLGEPWRTIERGHMRRTLELVKNFAPANRCANNAANNEKEGKADGDDGCSVAKRE